MFRLRACPGEIGGALRSRLRPVTPALTLHRLDGRGRGQETSDSLSTARSRIPTAKVARFSSQSLFGSGTGRGNRGLGKLGMGCIDCALIHCQQTMLMNGRLLQDTYGSFNAYLRSAIPDHEQELRIEAFGRRTCPTRAISWILIDLRILNSTTLPNPSESKCGPRFDRSS